MDGVGVVDHHAARLTDSAACREVDMSTRVSPLAPAARDATAGAVRTRSASYRELLAKRFTDATAQFALPRIGRHAASDTGELEITQRFDPGSRQPRPAPPAPQQRRDDNAR